MQTATNLIITLAGLSAALVLLQGGRAEAAPMAAAASQDQSATVRGSPETVALFELSAAKAHQQQQQVVRRRRSSDQWPRHAGLRPQRLASDAAFSQQLSDLITQARLDKTLERALLKMLINATLRPSTLAAGSQSGSELAAAESTAGAGASIDQLLASAERAQRDEQSLDGGNYPAVRLISNLEQILSSSPGFVDQSASSANGNDLGQLIAADAYGVDKREFKPCSFNAISCAKNPFRTSS